MRLIGNNLTNTHWKEIFFSAAKTLDLDPYKNPLDIQLQPVCNNKLFKYRNNTITYATFRYNPPKQLAEIINEDNTLMTKEQIEQTLNTNISMQNYFKLELAINQGCNTLGSQMAQ